MCCQAGKAAASLRIHLPAHPHYVLSALPAILALFPEHTGHCAVLDQQLGTWITVDLESAGTVDAGVNTVCLRLSGLSDDDCSGLTSSSAHHGQSSSSKRARSPSPPQSPASHHKRLKLHSPSPLPPSQPGHKQQNFPSSYPFSVVWDFVKAVDALCMMSNLDPVLDSKVNGISCKKSGFNATKKALRCGDEELWATFQASGALFSDYKQKVKGMPEISVLPWSRPGGPILSGGEFIVLLVMIYTHVIGNIFTRSLLIQHHSKLIAVLRC